MQAINSCCNILWLILFGWELFLIWMLFGIIYCLTFFGIPFGVQKFKLGYFALWPFGKKIVKTKEKLSIIESIGNLIWIIFGGLEIALITGLLSLLCFISIAGIPFGVQLCKLAAISLFPLGVEIVNDEIVLPSLDEKTPLQTQYIPSLQFNSGKTSSPNLPK